MNLMEARNRLAKNEITEEEAAMALGMSLVGLRGELERWGQRVEGMTEAIENGLAEARGKALKEAEDIIQSISSDSKTGDNHDR